MICHGLIFLTKLCDTYYELAGKSPYPIPRPARPLRWFDSIGGSTNHNLSIFVCGCCGPRGSRAAQRPPRQRRGTRSELLNGRLRINNRRRRMRRNRRLHHQLSHIIFASVCVVCGSRHKEKSVKSVKSVDKEGRKQ